ncbi:MAG: hypothetical protein N2482_03560 [Patescibacteria group bacterium]|nr:hypothetical protein [Patescibacteria group bacterium]
MKYKTIFLNIFLVVVSLMVGFFIGLNYQRARRGFGFDQGPQFNFQRGQRMFNQGTRPVSGEIIKKSEDSLTVKLRDGSTKIILLTESTNISKSTRGRIDDLKEKETVFVVGQQNSDGSITAENIQIGQFGFRIRGN